MNEVGSCLPRLKTEMQNAGSGATRPVIIRQENVSHVINVVNRGGIVYFVDAQMEAVVTLRPDVNVGLGRS